jgi:hypothetical protein
MFRFFVGFLFCLAAFTPVVQVQEDADEATIELKKTADSDIKPPNLIYHVRPSLLHLVLQILAVPCLVAIVLAVKWRARLLRQLDDLDKR